MLCPSDTAWSYPIRLLERLHGIFQAPENIPLQRECIACLFKQTGKLQNGGFVQSVMDQQCSFPRFSMSSGEWHPARRSVALVLHPPSQLDLHPSTPHCQSGEITETQVCDVTGLGHPAHATPSTAAHQRPRPVLGHTFSWLDDSRALALRSSWVAESDNANQSLNSWASHANVGSGDELPSRDLTRATLDTFSAHLSTPSGTAYFWTGPIMTGCW